MTNHEHRHIAVVLSEPERLLTVVRNQQGAKVLDLVGVTIEPGESYRQAADRAIATDLGSYVEHIIPFPLRHVEAPRDVALVRGVTLPRYIWPSRGVEVNWLNPARPRTASLARFEITNALEAVMQFYNRQ